MGGYVLRGLSVEVADTRLKGDKQELGKALLKSGLERAVAVELCYVFETLNGGSIINLMSFTQDAWCSYVVPYGQMC